MPTSVLNLKDADRRKEPVICGGFGPNETIGEILAAATALERIGYQPKLQFACIGDDPASIQLVVDDVGDVMTKLRASLTSTNHKEGRDR